MNFSHTNTILMVANLKPPFSPVEPSTISQILWYVGCPRRTGGAIGIGKRDRNPCYSPQDNQHGMFSHVVIWPPQRKEIDSQYVQVLQTMVKEGYLTEEELLANQNAYIQEYD